MNFSGKKIVLITSVLFLSTGMLSAQGLDVHATERPGDFVLVDGSRKAKIFIDRTDAKVVGIAAKAFTGDVKELSGKELNISEVQNINGDYIVLIGTLGHSSIIDQLVKEKVINADQLINKWESFAISVVNHPYGKAKQLLVIAGSDRRGTAFGVFHLSRLMGVSPFVWWADVHPAQMKKIFISGTYTSGEPSVKYRGIFINDEDWGLQPWAAAKMDTLIKDIGPNTYAHVFELMLRLKANYIWPAMHPCTKAFYYYKENPKVADDYAIVVGGSHCEPMLRNNVFEWAENFEQEYGKKPGDWRYDLNKDEMYRYWDDRVKESVKYESVYTVGMRGIHDGSMPGPKDPDQKLKLLENVITDQRKIFKDDFKKEAAEIPQIFVPYKEVLGLYRRGMQLPDDITIIWPDDNHGYIRQLPNEQERKRVGRHGVYYHFSYWGTPQDYLWLCSTSPALISNEMTKAYNYGADRLWVFNVGDIKPAELELQFSMDMAWDIKKYPPAKALDYIGSWAKETFGDQYADEIAIIKKEYYLLANAAKPEHINSVIFNSKERIERLKRYERLSDRALALAKKIPGRLKDAYEELVLYPVQGAAAINQKILYAQISKEQPVAASGEVAVYATRSMQAFKHIEEITKTYNLKTAVGKWNGIMDWKPRNQKVFEAPVFTSADKKAGADSIRQAQLPVITINADAYTAKQVSTEYRLEMIPGLGINGKGITLLRANDSSFSRLGNNDDVWLEYDLHLIPGKYIVKIKCLPVYDPGTEQKLRCAVSLDGDEPAVMNFHKETETPVWKLNVLRGYAEGQTEHVVNIANSHLRIYIKDIGLVLNTVEFYKAD